MKGPFRNLNNRERRLFARLTTPRKIQDFLETIPINFETEDVFLSPRGVIREQKAHCFEGALFAAAALWFHGQPPLLLDLIAEKGDDDHVVALFRARGRWGALSKTNHAVLRYREPVYLSPREIALSYFHEYFLDSGKKTLRSYSAPFDLRTLGFDWVTEDKNVRLVDIALDSAPHKNILTAKMARRLRPADPIEIRAGKLKQW